MKVLTCMSAFLDLVIKAAHSAHMRPLMVPDMLPLNKEMEELSEYILPSLIEVKEYLMAHFFNFCKETIEYKNKLW